MAPPPLWRPLALTTSVRGAPPLLVQASFTSSSYTLSITDLTTLWQETLTKREIIARALADETPIDPSEEASQFDLLLEKLSGGITEPDSIKELTLTRSGQGLRLKARRSLPEQLPDLKWTYQLAPQGNVAHTNAFVVPLLGLLNSQKDMIGSLLEIISDKDKTLGKIREHFEGDNADINKLVGASAPRRRGLKAFVEDKWREDMMVFGNRTAAEVVEEVFTDPKLDDRAAEVKGLPKGSEDWWKTRLEEDVEDEEEEMPVRASRPRPKPKAAPASPPRKRKAPTPQPVDDEETADEEDDFEVQHTPEKSASPAPQAPRPVSPARKSSPYPPTEDTSMPDAPKADDDATDDDEDLDEAPMRLGTIGGAPKSPTPEEPSEPMGMMGMVGGSRTVSPQASPSPEPSRLGMIGDVESPEPERLGMIGGATSPPSTIEEPQSKPKEETPESEEEDADTKADRKRRQLQLELEAKRKAPPKKKRKF